jgi:quinol monooxygenase YgiN
MAMEHIFLINPVEVDDSREIRFLEKWIKQASYARPQLGLLSMNLHRSIDDQSRFRFVIVEQWASLRALEDSEQIRQTDVPRHDYPCPQFPGVYRLFSK